MSHPLVDDHLHFGGHRHGIGILCLYHFVLACVLHETTASADHEDFDEFDLIFALAEIKNLFVLMFLVGGYGKGFECFHMFISGGFLLLMIRHDRLT